MIPDLKTLEVWFLTGSQHLYGEQTLRTVAAHAGEIAAELNATATIPVSIVFRPIVTTPDQITSACREASAASQCAGAICWMHTFSPAKMWIAGLNRLTKPFLHLHTQYNRDLPWSSIDMDFMNLNQSAHGDREFGFIGSRLRLNRKVVVGYWRDDDVISEIASWARAAAAWHDADGLRIARFGDNMRQVAVTEGDKVAAQASLRYSVNGYGIGELSAIVGQISDREVDALVSVYRDEYEVPADANAASIREAARIELGLRTFLEDGAFGGFTDTFEDLHGIAQLPGIAVQRLMADGYGFGGEGDWKTAALVRAMKVMNFGLPGGTSFMEDYTYHFGGQHAVLGAHMLEICPSIADGKPRLEVHPLSIGGKADPARLVFTSATGPAINASIVDVGNRFRMIVNEVEVIRPEQDMPKLPVARALWIPKPNLKVAAAAWIYAGGAHHTGFSLALNAGHMRDFADMAGIECLVIDAETRIPAFRDHLRWNDTSYLIKQ